LPYSHGWAGFAFSNARCNSSVSGAETVNLPEQPVEVPAQTIRKRRRLLTRLAIAFGFLLLAWILAAYVVLPWLWKHYEHQPELEDAPKVSLTASGIPGDPLNVALIGPERDIVGSMLKAGWFPADPITLGTSVRIARSVLRHKPYPDAPVSNLYVFGHRQDLAFEKAEGGSASRRHHVRFWKSSDLGRGGSRSGAALRPSTGASASVTGPGRSPTTSAPTSTPSATA